MGQGTEANAQIVIEQIAQAPLPRQEQGKLTGFALLFAGMRLTETGRKALWLESREEWPSRLT
jgi:hypothetical protein